MVADAASVREILVVLALAAVGLLLALLVAFTPWYRVTADPGRAAVVELRAPSGPIEGPGLTAAHVG